MKTQDKLISNREIFSIVIGAIVAMMFASIPMGIYGAHLSSELGIELDVLMTSHFGLIMMSLISTQLALCLVLANYVYRSKDTIKETLSLNTVSISPTLWTLLMLGSIAVSSVPALCFGDTAYMASFASMIANQPLGFGLLLIVMGSVLPGIVEEFICRGYLQRRLLNRWHPAVAIYVSSMFFAALHMDPTYALVILPFGLWLGFLHYHFKSILPSIVCHIANNAFAFSMLVVNAKIIEIPDIVMYSIIGVFVLCFGLCIARLKSETGLFTPHKEQPDILTAK